MDHLKNIIVLILIGENVKTVKFQFFYRGLEVAVLKRTSWFCNIESYVIVSWIESVAKFKCEKSSLFFVIRFLANFSTQSLSLESGNEDEIKRSKCVNILSVVMFTNKFNSWIQCLIYLQGENPEETRLQAFRAISKTSLIDAFILTSYDEHREELKDLSESPLMFFSGLNVRAGEAAVIKKSKFSHTRKKEK